MKMADKQQTHVCGDQTRTLVGYCNTCRRTISSATRPLEDDLQQHAFMAGLRYEFGEELTLLA
jgi:hypothetical protein